MNVKNPIRHAPKITPNRSPGKTRFELSLVDDTGANARLPGNAYNPYDVDPTVKRGPQARPQAPKSDLRKLSQWIKLKKEVEAIKNEDPVED